MRTVEEIAARREAATDMADVDWSSYPADGRYFSRVLGMVSKADMKDVQAVHAFCENAYLDMKFLLEEMAKLREHLSLMAEMGENSHKQDAG